MIFFIIQNLFFNAKCSIILCIRLRVYIERKLLAYMYQCKSVYLKVETRVFLDVKNVQVFILYLLFLWFRSYLNNNCQTDCYFLNVAVISDDLEILFKHFQSFSSGCLKLVPSWFLPIKTVNIENKPRNNLQICFVDTTLLNHKVIIWMFTYLLHRDKLIETNKKLFHWTVDNLTFDIILVKNLSECERSTLL